MTLRSREWYRTEGFKEISMDLAIDCSYRKASQKLNRCRGLNEENGTPTRTLAYTVETEGENAQRKIYEFSQEILAENNFTSEGRPVDDNTETSSQDSAKIALPKEQIEECIGQYNQDKDDELKIESSQADKFYENVDNTVNISLDEVGVKKQKEKDRSPNSPKKEKREYIRNMVTHIQHGGQSYILNTVNIKKLMPILIAFLLYNNLFKNFHLVFFLDGARNLKNSIFSYLDWFGAFSLILDWYHLEEKCKIQLSLALKGRKIRNDVLEKLLPLLWLGKVEKAIDYLKNLDKEFFKAGKTSDSLVGYLEDKRDFIPCYALRRELGLRVSSNRGEKANDLVVSIRQKHNGMSWSKTGSTALATVTMLHLNGEEKNWYSKKEVNFKLAA